MKSYSIILGLSLLLSVVIVQSAPITHLPDVDPADLPAGMDSGYITVDEQNHREIFYWFVPAETNPETAPLVIWFTGGPGCSGLLAFVTENGPLKVNRVTKGLKKSDFRWSQYANVLWIEQPAGVGYSYSEVTADYTTNDTKASEDNYIFVKKWLEQFPQFKGRDLWLTGESYAGTYIPTLSYQILSGSDESVRDQFKGFMLGNPVILCKNFGLGKPGSYPLQFNRYFYSGLVSYANYAKWNKLGCNQDVTVQCLNFFNEVEKEIGVFDQELKTQELLQLSKVEDIPLQTHPDLDPDNLYQDFCTGNATLDQAHEVNEKCYPQGDILSNYLNRKDVQEALHAKVGTKWEVCSGKLDYTKNDENEGLLPFLRKIFDLKPSLHILYYSGDVDIATVPTQVTQACLSELSDVVSVKKSWRPWRVNGWHAGYVEVFDKYTFATVKGAGHEVPGHQPFFGTKLFQRFLQKQNLDEPSSVVTPSIPKSRTQGSVLREMRREFHKMHVSNALSMRD